MSWPLTCPPNADGLYLVAVPCPGVEPFSGRILVWFDAGSPQPAFPCTAFRVTQGEVEKCYMIGEASETVLVVSGGDTVVSQPDLEGEKGVTCCSCRSSCTSTTIDYYEGANYPTAEHTPKVCCCGPKRVYGVVSTETTKTPVYKYDGLGGGSWDLQTRVVTIDLGWVYDATGPGAPVITAAGNVTTHTETWTPSAGPGGSTVWTLVIPSDTVESASCPSWFACAPWGMDPGLEWSTVAVPPSGFGDIALTRHGLHDCGVHSGYTDVVGSDDGTAGSAPHPAPDFRWRYEFSSTCVATDAGCSGGCTDTEMTIEGESP